MAKVDVKMSGKELVWVIHSIRKYGRTALLEELEEKLRILRRYEYPGHGKKRVYQTVL